MKGVRKIRSSLGGAVVLLYHGVPANGHGTCIDGKVFEEHIAFLTKHFDLIAADHCGQRRRPDKLPILLTFDDSFRNNAEVVAPILRKYNAPALFFVCSRHAIPGQYLWFSYLRALEEHFRGNGFSFKGEFVDMSEDRRRFSVKRLFKLLPELTPHPAAMYKAIEEELPRLEDFVDGDTLADRYCGMTAEQVGELAAHPLFSIGVHTSDHPLLTKCDREEACRQLKENKAWLEQVAHRKCDTVAYPSGDYDSGVLKLCHELGFGRGYAVIPVLGIDGPLEQSRLGIYSSSVAVLRFKIRWGNALRLVGMQIG